MEKLYTNRIDHHESPGCILEIAQWEDAVKEVNTWVEALDGKIEIIRQQMEEIKQLRKALQEYGCHKSNCKCKPQYSPRIGWFKNKASECTCGLKEALEGKVK